MSNTAEIPSRANFAGAAPRISVRETRRIVGEHVLTGEDCVEGRKPETGVAKGCHHIDIHGAGTKQTRIPMRNGGSYDIPYGCLVPKKLKNVYVAGRCMTTPRRVLALPRSWRSNYSKRKPARKSRSSAGFCGSSA